MESSDFQRNFYSNIDLLFSTANIAVEINVEAYDEPLNQFIILCYATFKQKKLFIQKTFRINSIKTDWLKVQAELDEKHLEFLSAEYDSLSPQENYGLFVEIIKSAIQNNTPRRKKSTVKRL